MPERIGDILHFSTPSILGFAAVGGKKEGEGPLGTCFDAINDDSTFGEATWEKSESRLQRDTLQRALDKAKVAASDIDVIFAGDLLNQCMASTFGVRETNAPFVGLFGACSTMAESLLMASVFVDAGIADHAVALTSSHFCSAERQFRFPLEYGGQRPPGAQWTVTGSGCIVLGREGNGPFVHEGVVGRVVDLGVTDQNNMGAAMAPAAADTLARFFRGTSTQPTDYDLIVSGDLGQIGSELLRDLLGREGFALGENYNDCGLMIFDRNKQDVHAGASGCGCSASVLCAYILNAMRGGALHNVLFMATGALMSPTSVQQGASIPGVAHLVHLRTDRQPAKGG